MMKLGKSEMDVAPIAIGCMRIANMNVDSIANLITYCVDCGFNFFDHADIYGGGQCETLFGQAFKKTGLKRDEVVIQSKCGIVPGKMYDFSREHILSSVNGILTRLDMEYLDVLVLHRPDALMEPCEVANTLDELYQSGKVHYFGVSNFRPSQIELLKKYMKQDILVNQLQLSITESNMITSGFEVNMTSSGSFDHDGSVLDYCRLNDITVQAWSPFQYGFFEGCFVGNREKFPKLNDTLDKLSKKYDVTPSGIATAWILSHPAKIQMVSGSTNVCHLEEIFEGSKICLSREDWYRLYLDGGHILP